MNVLVERGTCAAGTGEGALQSMGSEGEVHTCTQAKEEQGDRLSFSMERYCPGKEGKWIFRLEKSSKKNCKCQDGLRCRVQGQVSEGIDEIMK